MNHTETHRTTATGPGLRWIGTNFVAVTFAILTVLPLAETIDATRALTASETDAATSMQKTDAALGLVREFVPVSN